MTEEDINSQENYEQQEQQEQNEQEQTQETIYKHPKNPYLDTRHPVSIPDKIFEELEQIGLKNGLIRITKKKERKVDLPKLFQYLVDLEKINQANGGGSESLIKYRCKKCNQEVNIPKGINPDKLYHTDLICDKNDKNNGLCYGRIIKKFEVKPKTITTGEKDLLEKLRLLPKSGAKIIPRYECDKCGEQIDPKKIPDDFDINGDYTHKDDCQGKICRRLDFQVEQVSEQAEQTEGQVESIYEQKLLDGTITREDVDEMSSTEYGRLREKYGSDRVDAVYR